MIPRFAIDQWNSVVPWIDRHKVEQDLLICRALVAIYSDEYLARNLAFRGGTALHKLYLRPQPRYSEDIDLVQVEAGPIKETYDRIREALSFLGEPKVKQKKHNNTLVFKIDSDGIPSLPLHLKVEINCKEHFSVLPMVKIPFKVDNMWFSGETEILTYQLEELVGTKLRALYQRLKGRDLYDLYVALTNGKVDDEKVIECYKRYMGFVVEHLPTWKEFMLNMDEKMCNTEFIGDVSQLLRAGDNFDPTVGFALVKERLIDRLEGDRWK
ncbi:MAG: nucleotidyl transferase AbiEii/AbiGii toxin family protein [Bacteroidales bacterium]|nr:nucleotidyl transferase AbiEii/AbiGii toxin family protein [Bacteroidales bacterium]